MKNGNKACIVYVLLNLVFAIAGCGKETDLSASESESTHVAADIVEAENFEFVGEDEAVSDPEVEIRDENIHKPQEDRNEEKTSEAAELKDYTVISDLKPSEGLEFESNGDGTCTIKGIGVCTDENLVIPTESPKGERVTLIDEYAFYNLEDVDSVTLINCECEIDDYAFQYGEFTSLNIMGGCPIINKSAFSSCKDLAAIMISNCNLQSDEYAFFNCGKDTDIKFVECIGVIGKYAFQYSDMLTLEINNCELEIQKSAFSTCENLEVITIADTSIEAEEYAFFGCGDSAKVEMTNCQIMLDDYAFQYSSIENLVISGSKLETGKSAFSSCEDLCNVTIDCDFVTLDEYAFFGCEDLVNVSLCEKADENTEISIDDYAFQYCKNLEAVMIGGNTVEMGKYVFSGCAENLIITGDGHTYTAESVKDGISS